MSLLLVISIIVVSDRARAEGPLGNIFSRNGIQKCTERTVFPLPESFVRKTTHDKEHCFLLFNFGKQNRKLGIGEISIGSLGGLNGETESRAWINHCRRKILTDAIAYFFRFESRCVRPSWESTPLTRWQTSHADIPASKPIFYPSGRFSSDILIKNADLERFSSVLQINKRKSGCRYPSALGGLGDIDRSLCCLGGLHCGISQFDVSRDKFVSLGSRRMHFINLALESSPLSEANSDRHSSSQKNCEGGQCSQALRLVDQPLEAIPDKSEQSVLSVICICALGVMHAVMSFVSFAHFTPTGMFIGAILWALSNYVFSFAFSVPLNRRSENVVIKVVVVLELVPFSHSRW